MIIDKYMHTISVGVRKFNFSEEMRLKMITIHGVVLILIFEDVIIRELYQKICHQGECIIYKSLMSRKLFRLKVKRHYLFSICIAYQTQRNDDLEKCMWYFVLLVFLINNVGKEWEKRKAKRIQGARPAAVSRANPCKFYRGLIKLTAILDLAPKIMKFHRKILLDRYKYFCNHFFLHLK